MKTLKFNNVTPNGNKIDIFKLKEVPSSGKYGHEFEIMFQHLESTRTYYFGKVHMYDGRLVFYNDKGEETTEMRLNALKLLCEWIDKHKEFKEE